MSDSILDTIKKMLGIDPSYTQFDEDIIVLINSCFSNLAQIGIIPNSGYRITSNSETWDEVIGEHLNYDNLKSYIYLKVRLIFNPPSTSFALQAIQDEVKELEWRIVLEGGDGDEPDVFDG